MDTTLPSYAVLLASIFLIYFPVIALGNIEKVQLDELLRMVPRFAWFKRRYAMMLTVIFIPLVILAFYFSMNGDRLDQQFFLLLVPFVSAFSLLNGGIAFTTGIFPLWVTKNSIRYWYDEEHKKAWVAEVQIGLAIACIAGSLFLYFVRSIR